MQKTPHILNIIYIDGSRERLDISAQSQLTRQSTLNYWSSCSAVRTAFLTWK